MSGTLLVAYDFGDIGDRTLAWAREHAQVHKLPVTLLHALVLVPPPVAPDGIIIEAVQIEDIAFSDAFEQSIEARMQAEVEVARLQQNLARERVQADIVRAKAAGEADALKQAADAQAYQIQARAAAEADGIRARDAI